MEDEESDGVERVTPRTTRETDVTVGGATWEDSLGGRTTVGGSHVRGSTWGGTLDGPT